MLLEFFCKINSMIIVACLSADINSCFKIKVEVIVCLINGISNYEVLLNIFISTLINWSSRDKSFSFV